MMLLHCTASRSTFEAHPHYPERVPNLNPTDTPQEFEEPQPRMVRMPPLGYLIVVHQSFCCVQSTRHSVGSNEATMTATLKNAPSSRVCRFPERYGMESIPPIAQ